MIIYRAESGTRPHGATVSGGERPAGGWGACFAGEGKRGASGSHLLVRNTIYEKFISDLTTASAKIHVANPEDKTTEAGPINTSKHYPPIRLSAPYWKPRKRIRRKRAAILFSYPMSPVMTSALHAGNRKIHHAHEETSRRHTVNDKADAVRIAHERGYGRSSGIDVLHAGSEVTRLWTKTAENPLFGFIYGAGEEKPDAYFTTFNR